MKNEFETQIDRLITKINQNGYGFGWKNHPQRTDAGLYIKGEPFDYCILCRNGNILCFDAKAIHSKTWRLQPKDIKQQTNLLKAAMNNKCKAFFIVYFYIHKAYRIIHVANMYNKKTIKFEEMEDINLETFLQYDKV